MHTLLNKFDTTSEIRLIQSVSSTIQESSDPLRQANSFITSCGIAPVADETCARIVSLCLAEFAYHNMEFDVDKAIQYVSTRYNKVVDKVYDGAIKMNIQLVRAKEGQTVDIVSDKAIKARAIYDEWNGKVSKNQIANKIAEQLGITKGNAGYYVFRCFAGKK